MATGFCFSQPILHEPRANGTLRGKASVETDEQREWDQGLCVPRANVIVRQGLRELQVLLEATSGHCLTCRKMAVKRPRARLHRDDVGEAGIVGTRVPTFSTIKQNVENQSLTRRWLSWIRWVIRWDILIFAFFFCFFSSGTFWVPRPDPHVM